MADAQKKIFQNDLAFLNFPPIKKRPATTSGTMMAKVILADILPNNSARLAADEKLEFLKVNRKLSKVTKMERKSHNPVLVG